MTESRQWIEVLDEPMVCKNGAVITAVRWVHNGNPNVGPSMQLIGTTKDAVVAEHGDGWYPLPVGGYKPFKPADGEFANQKKPKADRS